MKIGFFTSNIGGGGSESYLLDLMLGARSKGHHPILFGVKGTRLFKDALIENIDVVACSKIRENKLKVVPSKLKNTKKMAKKTLIKKI